MPRRKVMLRTQVGLDGVLMVQLPFAAGRANAEVHLNDAD